MTDKKLIFKQTKTEADMINLINHNSDAFVTGITSSKWNLEDLQKEAALGWEIFSAIFENQIVAAVFMKNDKNSTLATKNTPIKLEFQGNGFSHIIKEFYEDEAINRKLSRITNLCPDDNFRMISLNEGHSYHRTGLAYDDNDKIEIWEKKI